MNKICKYCKHLSASVGKSEHCGLEWREVGSVWDHPPNCKHHHEVDDKFDPVSKATLEGMEKIHIELRDKVREAEHENNDLRGAIRTLKAIK